MPGHGSFNALAATKQAFGSDSAGFEARARELLTQQDGPLLPEF